MRLEQFERFDVNVAVGDHEQWAVDSGRWPVSPPAAGAVQVLVLPKANSQ
jgi:hypothetical protein